MTRKVSGFTLIRNGSKFDYPFLESFASIEPWVDEFVINVGKGEDDTLQRIQAWAKVINDRAGRTKVILFETDWQLDVPERKKSGLILSEQTNLALDRCSGDWCVYIQADEVFHETDSANFKNALDRADNDPEVEGLLFDYVHFYGSYDVIQVSRSAYRREVRAFKRSSGARSVGDAQSFRKKDGSKLHVMFAGARVFHYGWVRTPEAMRQKTYFMDTLYHGEPTGSELPHTGENFRYKRFWGLRRYEGNHPLVMLDRIKTKGWRWDLEGSPFTWIWKDIKKITLDLFERLTGIRLFEYRSYLLLPRARIESVDLERPEVSLFLSTYEMPRHLELVLAGLSCQSFLNFEVILCDDGSGSETKRIIDAYKRESPFRVEHVWHEHKGFRKCKILNEGLRRARGRTFVFLDGDCLPHRDFIRDHVEHQEAGRYLAGRRVELGQDLSSSLQVSDVYEGFFEFPRGRLLMSFLRGDSQFLNRCFRVSSQILRRLLKMDRVVDLKGCNYSVSRENMLAINGFDETYEGYGREDTDVELRLQHSGLKIKSLKGLALQFHIWHPRREFTPANDSMLEEVKRARRVWCERGVSLDQSRSR